MRNSVQLPSQFKIGNTPLYWAILSFLLLGVMIFIQVARGDLYKEFYAFIGLVMMSAFCGFKFLYERFNQTIFVDEGKISSKNIFGKDVIINWEAVENVTLSKAAAIVVKGGNNSIKISLKIKDWKTLLEVLEMKIPDEKFDF